MSNNTAIRALKTSSEQQTLELGQRLARCLRPSDVVTLDGPLGVGKTRLAAGIAIELGVAREDVTSPTFTLIHEYPTDPPLAHLDAYRLADSEEFLNLGVSEFWEDGIVVIEWGSKVRDALPKWKIEIVGSAITDHDREWTLQASAAWMQEHEATLRRSG